MKEILENIDAGVKSGLAKAKLQPLVVEIEPPITEYCTSCDYEAHYSFLYTHYNCPECGDNSINSGQRNKHKFIFVTANLGNYNWANPSEKQWNYTFHNLPGGKSASFTVSEELSTDDPFELLQELKDIYGRYLYSSSKKTINDLVEKLCTEDEMDRQWKMRNEARIIELKTELYKLLRS